MSTTAIAVRNVAGQEVLFSHKPVKCPLGDCNSIVGASTIFNHFLVDHHGQTYEFFKMSENQVATLLINMSAFGPEDNTCLGIFAFSGPTLHGPYPAEQGICLPNSLLPSKWEQYKSFLAVLVMGCRLPSNRIIGNADMSRMQPGNDVLVFWFISGQTTTPVFATICIHNKDHSISRRKVVRIRTLNEDHDPANFLSNCSEYLFVNKSELDVMDDDKDGCVLVDIKLHLGKDIPRKMTCCSKNGHGAAQ